MVKFRVYLNGELHTACTSQRQAREVLSELRLFDEIEGDGTARITCRDRLGRDARI